MAKKTVCVIGASGFIGINTVLSLHERGHRIRAAVRHATSAPADWQSKGIEIVEAEVTNPASLVACVQGCEVVINCAGIYRWWVPDQSEYLRVNDVGAGLVAEACLEQKVKRLVHYSTPMAYGYPEERPFTEASEPGCHASEYARTKHLGDVRIKSLCQGTSLQTVFLYLGCTIGAGDAMTAGRIAAVIRDYIHGKIPMLVGPDTNYIYVHIKDVRRAVAAAVEAPAEKVSGEDFFIANSDDMMTTRQFFALIGKHTGVPPPTRSLPLSLAYRFASVTSWLATNITGAEPTAPVDVIRTAQLGSIEYTCGKSVKVLGMSYASIDEAVAESVADVKQRLGLVAKG